MPAHLLIVPLTGVDLTRIHQNSAAQKQSQPDSETNAKLLMV